MDLGGRLMQGGLEANFHCASQYQEVCEYRPKLELKEA
jgi:hypothetical protein